MRLTVASVQPGIRSTYAPSRLSSPSAAVAGERFDAIVSNPPYVPALEDKVPARGRARLWDAGRDDLEASGLLEPGQREEDVLVFRARFAT